MTYFPAFAVSSARRGLTSLFGMGRGGTPGLLPPGLFIRRRALRAPALCLPDLAATADGRVRRETGPAGGKRQAVRPTRQVPTRSGTLSPGASPWGRGHVMSGILCSFSADSPRRAVRRGLAPRKGFGLLVQLGCRRRRPCTCCLSTSSSATALPGGYLISGGASCLDAFSTYPGRTRLPGRAPGGTTGSPEVRPTRSSRTSVGSPQISCAHNR